MKYYIGIDLGGTNIAGGLVDENGKILKKISVPTEVERGENAIIDNIADLCGKICDESNIKLSQVEKIGIGVPGTVGNMENGTYTLNAYLTNDTTDGICYLYAKTNGHTMASTSIPISDNESKVTVPGIIVEDGKCDIGLYIKGSQTLTLDKLSFAKSEVSRIPFLNGGEI